MRKEVKGFLVVGEAYEINGIEYHGVNTNAWPIGENFDSELAERILEESFHDLSLPMLVDFDSAFRYCLQCEHIGIKPRMLFCEVLMDQSTNGIPSFATPQRVTCLGFDYAYPSGDYYSAVANDILYRDDILPTNWKKHLNGFGLLPTMGELTQFAEERALAAEESEKHGHGMLFEKGYFVYFRVFLVEYGKECFN